MFCVNKDSVAVKSAIQPPPECEVEAEDLSESRELARQKARALVPKANSEGEGGRESRERLTERNRYGVERQVS